MFILIFIHLFSILMTKQLLRHSLKPLFEKLLENNKCLSYLWYITSKLIMWICFNIWENYSSVSLYVSFKLFCLGDLIIDCKNLNDHLWPLYVSHFYPLFPKSWVSSSAYFYTRQYLKNCKEKLFSHQK